MENDERLIQIQEEATKYARGLKLPDLGVETRLAQVRAKTYEAVLGGKLVLHIRNLSARLCAQFGSDCLVNFDPSICITKILNDGVMIKLLVRVEKYDAILAWLGASGYDCTDAVQDPDITEKFKAFCVGISFVKMEKEL